MPIVRPVIMPALAAPQTLIARRRNSNMLNPALYQQEQEVKEEEDPFKKREPVTSDYIEQQLAKMKARPARPLLEPGSRVKVADQSIAAPGSFQSYYQTLGLIDEYGQSALNAAQAQAAMRRMQSRGNIGSGGGGGGGGPTQLQFQGGGNMSAWIDEAASILSKNGINLSPQDKIYISTIIKHESGGNPNAINNWDINAKNGIPSKGLMQTIDPTFNSNMLPGYNSIYNPVHNIIAGVRYALRRYGSLANVPGIRGLNSGGRYVGY
jgi:hypothetical protein